MMRAKKPTTGQKPKKPAKASVKKDSKTSATKGGESESIGNSPNISSNNKDTMVEEGALATILQRMEDMNEHVMSRLQCLEDRASRSSTPLSSPSRSTSRASLNRSQAQAGTSIAGQQVREPPTSLADLRSRSEASHQAAHLVASYEAHTQ